MPGAGPGVILASGSPRRRELLELLGVPFEVVVSDVDETSSEPDPARLAGQLAQAKAQAVARQQAGAVVIAADTVVGCGGDLLAKPASRAQNADFIRRLSGRTHQVYTGVCVLAPAGTWTEVERTDVTFRDLSGSDIEYYAASGEGLDKAGGYGIQGLGMALVSRIAGDYSNVVGFPLARVVALLRQAGVRVWSRAEDTPDR